MSGGTSTPVLTKLDGGITELYTGLPTKIAYSRIKSLLNDGSYTEDINVVYAEGLTIAFSQDSSGMATLRMQGANVSLLDEINATFN